MKKTIRLTKSKLSKVIKRIIREDIGFVPSYMKPEIHVVINFDVPGTTKDLKPVIRELLERKNIKLNHVFGSHGGRNNPYKLDVSVYNERDIKHLINDLHLHLMVVHEVKIKDVTYFIK